MRGIARVSPGAGPVMHDAATAWQWTLQRNQKGAGLGMAKPDDRQHSDSVANGTADAHHGSGKRIGAASRAADQVNPNNATHAFYIYAYTPACCKRL